MSAPPAKRMCLNTGPRPVPVRQPLAELPSPTVNYGSSQPAAEIPSEPTPDADARLGRIYRQLAALDPYRASPPCFLNLLARAALYSPDIARDIQNLVDEQVRSLPGQTQPSADPRPTFVPFSVGLIKQGGVVVKSYVESWREIPPASAPHKKTTTTKRKRQESKPDRPAKDTDFSKSVQVAQVALGWTGKWDRLSKSKEFDKAFDVAAQLDKTIGSITTKLQEQNTTYATKESGVKTIVEILHSVCETTGSYFGKEVRRMMSENKPEKKLLQAMEAFSPDELRKLFTKDDGWWFGGLDCLMKEAKSYCMYDGLPAVKEFCQEALRGPL